MSDKTKIQWTDATWSPLRARVRSDAKEIASAKGYTSLLPILHRIPPGKIGHHCEHVSPGCEHCYSETNNARCLPANGTGLPFDRRSRDLVEMFLDEEMLTQPLRWKKPRRIFVESQSDLFGEFVRDELIDRVFAVMALCPQHTFQVLTKRADRMREYSQRTARVAAVSREEINALALSCEVAVIDSIVRSLRWPLLNVWLGVSCEDKQRADERIQHLLQTPAALWFVSYEPALGPVDFEDYFGWSAEVAARGLKQPLASALRTLSELPGIDWVIVGAESGPGARPMDIAWVRSAIAQCKASGVACFVKQLGRDPMQEREVGTAKGGCHVSLELKDRKGGDMSEWPADLRVREMPEAVTHADRP